MPRISLAQSDIIKRRLFRAREHVECCELGALSGHIETLSLATYELAHTLGLPAVRHETGVKAAPYVEDLRLNLTTLIDFDLTLLEVNCDPEIVVRASQEFMTAVHTIPLPAQPPARTA